MPAYQSKTEHLLAIFDASKSWLGLVELGKRVKMSRQGVQRALLRYRRERYMRLRHPSRGTRNDLRGGK